MECAMPLSVDPNALSRELDACDIELEPQHISKLASYADALWQWNERINLTRHTDLASFVTRDVLDTVQLSACLAPDEEVLDVGSGGGVPGLILAMIRPDLQVVVCDSVAKKARVLEDIIQRLELSVPVFASRAEELVEDLRFDSLVARAVGPLPKLIKWFDGRWQNFSRLLAIKGPRWSDERSAARHRGLLKDLQIRKLSSYPMPGTDSESVIVQISLRASNAQV